MTLLPLKYLHPLGGKYIFLLVLIGVAPFLNSLPVQATARGTDRDRQQLSSIAKDQIPVRYGEIVFQRNSSSSKQLFIIGQAHRSGITGKSTPYTVQVQAEIFRIGEWLRQQQDVQLLLPEGFFDRTFGNNPVDAQFAAEMSSSPEDHVLKERLSEAGRFINADLLLRSNYHMPMGQVENEALYKTIRDLLKRFSLTGDFATLCRINELQRKRSAVLLKNIPEVIEQAYTGGRISNRKAMFTIGMAHIAEIMEILSINAETEGFRAFPDNWRAVSSFAPELLTGEYGITVIIPRSLSENTTFLRHVGLFR